MNQLILRFVIISLTVLIASPVFSDISVEDDEPGDLIVDDSVEPLEPIESEVVDDASNEESTRSARGGELEWYYTAPKGGSVSTPALVDLDADGFQEVIFATSGDEITALNHDGSKRWVNSNYVFDTATEFQTALGMNYWAPGFFSSITPANIDRDVRPELIIGGYNGLIFLNHDGEPKYSQSHTGRYYFTTPLVTDLEGDYSNVDIDSNSIAHYKDLEILTGSVDTGRNAYLEAWHATGGDIFDYNTAASDYMPFMIGLSTGDMDGSMEDDKFYQFEEAWMELAFADYSTPLRIYGRNASQFSNAHGHNHPTYKEKSFVNKIGTFSFATPAIGNFTKVTNLSNPQQLEIIIGVGGWTDNQGLSGDYTNAGLYSYDEYGNQHWHALDKHIIASSPAVCDVQGLNLKKETKHLAEFEIFAGDSHEGEFFSVDADNGSLLWSWEIEGAKSTSNRILSSPAICDIGLDGDLEVVVGSNNGRVYCFDGDPSDGVNDGEEYSAYSGEGTTQFDIIWEYDTNDVPGAGNIGVSSPVVADIDKDGVLEVLIGDAGGTVYCISAGGTSARGQRDWTMFHYDLNNSGLYNPKIRYAVDIKAARDPYTGIIDTTQKFLEPGEKVTYNLSVINEGYGRSLDDFDHIYIQYNIEHYWWNPDWKVTLKGNKIKTHDHYRYVTLPMQEHTMIQLNVTAPWTGEMGDFLTIRVRVNSSKDHNAEASITTVALFQIKIDFKLQYNLHPIDDPLSPYYDEKLVEMDTLEERIIDVSLQNIGDKNDSYRITVVDFEMGWDVEWLNNPGDDRYTIEVSLDSAIFGGYNSTLLQLRVKVPEDEKGDEVSFITIEGVSNASEEEQKKLNPKIGLIKRKDTMLIRIKTQIGMNITITKSLLYFKPGEQLIFKIYVENNGNVPFSVGLSLSLFEKGWIVSMPSIIDVYAQDIETVNIIVTAPSEEYQPRAGDTMNLTVEGLIDTAEGPIKRSVNLTGVIDTVYKLNVTITPDFNETTAGGTVGHIIHIVNEGNGDDIVEISTDLIDTDWSILYESDRNVKIGWKETKSIRCEIRVFEFAEPGLYYTVVNITGSGPGDVHFITLSTVVNHYDLNVEVYNDYNNMYLTTSSKYIEPGNHTTVDFRVTNDGNSEDIAHVWFYMYKYKKSGVIGSLSNADLTAEESDNKLLFQDHDKDARWYITSIRSSATEGSTKFVEKNFNALIDVDSVDGTTYVPKSGSNSKTHVFLKLAPGQSAYVQIRVDYPVLETMDPMFFNLESMSKDGETNTANNIATLTIDVVHPDLTYDPFHGEQGIEIIGKKKVGTDKIDINIHVRNVGKATAENIEVALYIDNVYIESRYIDTLVNSSIGSYVHRYVVFSWKTSAPGSYDVSIVIDNGGVIKEENEDNNEARTTLKISGVVEEGRSSVEMGGIIAVIIIVIILLFIILWPFLRRQWPTQTLEEEVKEEIAEKTKGVTIIDASPKVPKHLPAYKCVICGTIVPKDQECPSCENN